MMYTNGNSDNSYPASNKNGSMIFPYYKFMDASFRYINPESGGGLKSVSLPTTGFALTGRPVIRVGWE